MNSTEQGLISHVYIFESYYCKAFFCEYLTLGYMNHILNETAHHLLNLT